MAQILVECPTCKRRLSLRKTECKCGTPSSRFYPKKYWIEFYDNKGKRKRESIGYSKQAAEVRLAKVRTSLAENKVIAKDPSTVIPLSELVTWYFDLPEVKALKSKGEYKIRLNKVFSIISPSITVSEITKGMVDGYLVTRTKQRKVNGQTGNVTRLSANEELAALSIVLNKAVDHQVIAANPLASIKRKAPPSARMRILTKEEYQQILNRMVKKHANMFMLAYITGMRYQEIAQLTWKEIDMDNWVIRLPAERCKNKTARVVPIHHPDLKSMFFELQKGNPDDYVLPSKRNPGRPYCRQTYRELRRVCKELGIKDFRFHDLRHCAVTNFRRSGMHDFVTMAIIGHKSLNMMQRYNTVVESEIRAIEWMDTDVDTKKMEVNNTL